MIFTLLLCVNHPRGSGSVEFKYRSEDIYKIANAPKILEANSEIKFTKHKEKGLKGDWAIRMPENPWARLQLHVIAGIPDQLYSFRAALLLDNSRIRGVDFSPVNVS